MISLSILQFILLEVVLIYLIGLGTTKLILLAITTNKKALRQVIKHVEIRNPILLSQVIDEINDGYNADFHIDGCMCYSCIKHRNHSGEK